jgi:hypothetical protein
MEKEGKTVSVQDMDTFALYAKIVELSKELMAYDEELRKRCDDLATEGADGGWNNLRHLRQSLDGLPVSELERENPCMAAAEHLVRALLSSGLSELAVESCWQFQQGNRIRWYISGEGDVPSWWQPCEHA